MFDFRLTRSVEDEDERVAEASLLVTPGCVVTSDSGFMRGHGTWIDEDEKICATVAGTVERINKLFSVRPQRSRYNGEVGDVIVGRIVEVQHKRWAVDVNARLNAILLLSSVNLPGGLKGHARLSVDLSKQPGCHVLFIMPSSVVGGFLLRRKTEEDELMLRSYLEVGDLISAEVQSVFADGSLSLHSRSLKYGKLSQGQLVKVPSALIQRKKTHFHNIVSGIQIILSNNGYIWISPQSSEDVETGGYAQNLECVSKIDRESIARLRNCILALTKHNKMLCDTTILYAFDASSTYEAKEILKPEVMKFIVESVKQRIELEGS